jgi:hypothetical protein
LVVDESVSAWRGAEYKWKVEGVPHSTKIPRKPESVGVELKDMADGETGIILAVEIQEGKEAEKLKDYAQRYGSGTSLCLRLTKHYWGSKRVLVGDSAFASVKTVAAMWEHAKLFFWGMVKQAHSEYPKKYLEAIGKENPLRGSTEVMISELADGTKVRAVGWYDRKHKHLVGSGPFDTSDAEPAERRRHRVVRNDAGVMETVTYLKKIPRSLFVKQFFSVFSNIDIHNHLRQGILRVAKVFVTNEWWKRVFQTLFSTTVVDAFRAYEFETKSNFLSPAAPVPFLDFVNQLAYHIQPIY